MRQIRKFEYGLPIWWYQGISVNFIVSSCKQKMIKRCILWIYHGNDLIYGICFKITKQIKSRKDGWNEDLGCPGNQGSYY